MSGGDELPSNAVLTYNQHTAFALKIENLLGQQTPEDILSIIAIVADNAIHLVKDKHERRRTGVLFINYVKFLAALGHDYPEEVEEGPGQYDRRHGAGIHLVSRDGETVDESEVSEEGGDETESLMSGLLDYCAAHSYPAILGAVPGAVGMILRDFPEENDRNQIILETIFASAARRSEVKSRATKKAIRDLNTLLKPVMDRIKPIRGNRVRNAVILEMVDALTRLADV